jgi:hypothetical protein
VHWETGKGKGRELIFQATLKTYLLRSREPQTTTRGGWLRKQGPWWHHLWGIAPSPDGTGWLFTLPLHPSSSPVTPSPGMDRGLCLRDQTQKAGQSQIFKILESTYCMPSTVLGPKIEADTKPSGVQIPVSFLYCSSPCVGEGTVSSILLHSHCGPEKPCHLHRKNIASSDRNKLPALGTVVQAQTRPGAAAGSLEMLPESSRRWRSWALPKALLTPTPQLGSLPADLLLQALT